MVDDNKIKKMYYHWSYPFLCIYCFIGLLAGGVILAWGIMSTPNPISDMHFGLGITVIVTSVIAGAYIKYVDDRNTERQDREFKEFRRKYWSSHK